MVATLQSRKEALEAKILEKNEELKKLCLQEADLTGVIPPEIPLEPGEPPPPIRRRVGTSFSFPQNLLNNIKDADDESLIALEVECKVQTNIAEAALTLANDTTVNKAARRKHRLMYRQSQRRLSELEARLNLLRQGKTEQGKPQQVKKKPRPNTTAVENLGYIWNKGQAQTDNQQYNGNNNVTWINKRGYSADELDGSRELSHSDIFGSLHRSYKSSGTSQGSSSPKVDLDSEDNKSQSLSGLHINNQFATTGSYPSIQDMLTNKPSIKVNNNISHHKRSPKRAIVRKQWDTQSAGGTLLPNQTYPDHSHQPNLSRAQSLGSVEANSQRSGKTSWNAHDFPLEGNSSKEKEWYETSLDSAPSPPLRTLSRLPSTARMLYQMQEMQTREWNGVSVAGLQQTNSNVALPTTNPTHRSVVRSVSAYQAAENSVTDELAHSVQQMNLTSKPRMTNYYVSDNNGLMQNEFSYGQIQDNRNFHDFPKSKEHLFYQSEQKQKQDFSQLDAETDEKYTQSDSVSLIRQNSLTIHKYKGNALEPEAVLKRQETIQDNNFRQNDAIYINIPEDNAECSTMKNWMNDAEYARNDNKLDFQPKPKVATQPYYHSTKPKQPEKIENLQYQAARNRYNVDNQPNVPVHHPPHAITQNEITFDTVVPFESPQNHTVVQAGKWQPYREVTKPFEMSDFYKYSTKFRQNNQNNPKPQVNRASTPEISRSSPNTLHQKAIYTPLRPMTCHPIETKPNQVAVHSNQVENFSDDIDHNHLVEVSLPEIV